MVARRREVEKNLPEIYWFPDGDCLTWSCPLCGEGSRPDHGDYACRVCGNVYHKKCCEADGRYDEFDISTMDRAFTKVGWSCYDCDNASIVNILTPEHNMEISDIFNEYDINGDGSITLEEYLGACKHILGRELSGKEREEEEKQFGMMDRDASGEIEMSEFLASEAPHFIRKYDREQLIASLTPLEKKRAREIFERLDRDGDGSIDYSEATMRMGLENWCHLSKRVRDIVSLQGTPADFERRRPSKSSVTGQHLFASALNIRNFDENHDGKIEWDEFLRGHVLKIILARPNKSDQAVRKNADDD